MYGTPPLPIPHSRNGMVAAIRIGFPSDPRTLMRHSAHLRPACMFLSGTLPNLEQEMWPFQLIAIHSGVIRRGRRLLQEF